MYKTRKEKVRNHVVETDREEEEAAVAASWRHHCFVDRRRLLPFPLLLYSFLTNEFQIWKNETVRAAKTGHGLQNRTVRSGSKNHGCNCWSQSHSFRLTKLSSLLWLSVSLFLQFSSLRPNVLAFTSVNFLFFKARLMSNLIQSDGWHKDGIACLSELDLTLNVVRKEENWLKQKQGHLT